MAQRLILMLAVLTVLSIAGQTVAKEREVAWIQNAWITGNEYRQMPESQRVVYVMGLLDGIKISPFFGAPSGPEGPEGVLARQYYCTKGMSNYQLEAILQKFLNEHPERWHDDIHTLFYGALDSACDLK